MSNKEVQFSDSLLDELLSKGRTKSDIFGANGLLKQLSKAIIERTMDAELTECLGYDKHDPAGKNSGNSRNGCSQKTLKGEHGEITINVPRDRNGNYSPTIIPKNQTRFDGFDEKIISLYARGMSTKDIKAQLEDLYQVEVSATLISTVTNEVLEEVKEWQSRTLDKVYPIVYMDALMIKVREDGGVINKAFYLALGINMDGQKEILGVWVSQNEGAKFWLNVLTELKNRGLEDIFIACVDGLSGFPEAINSVYPQAQVQLCIVHMVRNSLRYVSWKNRKEVAGDLKTIYRANTENEAKLALTEFGKKWDDQYPSISKSWINKWENLSVFFEYPQDIRKVIYTTNPLESVNMSARKVIKNKRVFPSDDAAYKLLYLALNNIAKKWTMPIHDWKAALSRFAIMFEGRMPEQI